MPINEKPDDRLTSLSPEKNVSVEEKPEIYAIANFENQHCLNRRDFLSETAKIAALIGLSSLIFQTGCAITRNQSKVKVPTTVSVKENGASLKKEPNGDIIQDPSITGDMKNYLTKNQQFNVIEQQGDWLKIQSDDGITGWISNKDVIYTNFTEKILPCGSPIPSGSTCICNCVPTYSCGCNPHSRSYCSCVPVCTCNLVPVS